MAILKKFLCFFVLPNQYCSGAMKVFWCWLLLNIMKRHEPPWSLIHSTTVATVWYLDSHTRFASTQIHRLKFIFVFVTRSQNTKYYNGATKIFDTTCWNTMGNFISRKFSTGLYVKLKEWSNGLSLGTNLFTHTREVSDSFFIKKGNLSYSL